MKNLSKILLIIAIIAIDIILYIVIGLILLGYEDMFDESKGEYWSLASMSLMEKIAFISYYILIIINVLIVCYFIYKMVKKFIIKK